MTVLRKLAGTVIGIFLGALWAAGWWSVFAEQPFIQPRYALVVVTTLLTVVLAIPTLSRQTPRLHT